MNNQMRNNLEFSFSYRSKSEIENHYLAIKPELKNHLLKDDPYLVRGMVQCLSCEKYIDYSYHKLVKCDCKK